MGKQCLLDMRERRYKILASSVKSIQGNYGDFLRALNVTAALFSKPKKKEEYDQHWEPKIKAPRYEVKYSVGIKKLI